MRADRLALPFAAYAENVDLDGGTLRGFRTPAKVSDQTGRSLWVHECCTLTSDRCMSWADTGIGCTRTIVRVGDGKPVMACADSACKDEWCPMDFDCAMPAPKLLSGGASESFARSTTAAVYTLVQEICGVEYETAPSLASDMVDVDNNGQLTVSGWPAAPTDRCLTKRRIYLLRDSYLNGSEKEPLETDWYRVAELPVGQASATVQFDEPGDLLATREFEPIPSNLRDVSSWQTGQLAGLAGDELRFSDRAYPHSWPRAYAMKFLSKPVRWITGRHAGFVLTNGQPAVVRLDQSCDKPFCHQAEHLQEELPIVSAESAAMVGDSVIYASREGLVMIHPSGKYEMVSMAWWDRRAWENINPHSMRAAEFAGAYYFSTTKGTWRLELPVGGRPYDAKRALVRLSIRPTAWFSDNRGWLYFTDAEGTWKWDAGEDFMPWRWRSPVIYRHEWCLGYYYVQLGWPGVEARWWLDGGALAHDPVTDEEPMGFPVGYCGKRIQFELCGTGEVLALHAAPGILELYERAGA